MKNDESSRKLESLVEDQRDKIRRLEDLVARLTYQDRGSLSRTETLVSSGLEKLVKLNTSEVFEDDTSTTVGEPSEAVPTRELTKATPQLII